jgi:hypothetical protein
MRRAVDLLGAVPEDQTAAQHCDVLPGARFLSMADNATSPSTLHATTPVLMGLHAQMQFPAVVLEVEADDLHASKS